MVGGRQLGFDVKEFAKVLPKARRKLRATVGDDLVREAMKSPYMFQKELGGFLGPDSLVTGYKVAHLRKTIYYNHDTVVTMA